MYIPPLFNAVNFSFEVKYFKIWPYKSNVTFYMAELDTNKTIHSHMLCIK